MTTKKNSHLKLIIIWWGWWGVIGEITVSITLFSLDLITSISILSICVYVCFLYYHPFFDIDYCHLLSFSLSFDFDFVFFFFGFTENEIL